MGFDEREQGHLHHHDLRRVQFNSGADVVAHGLGAICTTVRSATGGWLSFGKFGGEASCKGFVHALQRV